MTSRGEAHAFLEAALLVKTDACILWPFAATPKGYPRYKDTYAHREVCRRKHGEPPNPDDDAAHNCHTPKCINGDHLRWDTRTGNLADMVLDGTDRRGEKSESAVLTREQVGTIRARSSGMAALSKSLGVSLRYCYKIRAGDKRKFDD